MSVEIMRTLIDPTSFGYIKRAVMERRHGLMGIILVTEKGDLAEVAHVCESGNSERFDQFVKDGTVKFVISHGHYVALHGMTQQSLSVSWDMVNGNAALECILLPPFYVIKLTGKERK